MPCSPPKDWLGNDPSVLISNDDVDKLINSNFNLKLSADLANGAKHLALTKSRTKDLLTDITRNNVKVLLCTGSSAHVFYVASGGTEFDVLEIAEKAVAEWKSFSS